MRGLLPAEASLGADLRLWERGLRERRHVGLVVVQHVASSRIRDRTCVSGPWQIDSQPLDHGGSPKFYSWQESTGPLMLTIWLWGSRDHQPMTILVRMWVSPKMSSQRNANWTQLRPWVLCISKDGLNFPLGSEWLLGFTQNLVCLSVSIPYCLRTLLSGLSESDSTRSGMPAFGHIHLDSSISGA